jgi:hypothetical protein
MRAVTQKSPTNSSQDLQVRSVRGVLVLALMFAAAAQGVLAQAHVHFRLARAPAAGLVVAVASSPNDGGAPDQDSRGDPSSCALCQVLASGAAPLGHSFDLALALASLDRHLARAVDEPTNVGAVTHIWTSRGPPRI